MHLGIRGSEGSLRKLQVPCRSHEFGLSNSASFLVSSWSPSLPIFRRSERRVSPTLRGVGLNGCALVFRAPPRVLANRLSSPTNWGQDEFALPLAGTNDCSSTSLSMPQSRAKPFRLAFPIS